MTINQCLLIVIINQLLRHIVITNQWLINGKPVINQWINRWLTCGYSVINQWLMVVNHHFPAGVKQQIHTLRNHVGDSTIETEI